ncbi:MAG: endo-inulinase [Pedosphaera sp.]|nr:endo-inulinase [Pedosphaera sp.]
MRRVTYDLTGLPPAPSDVDDFIRDQSKDAFEKVVDRLLASKHFGERMAVPWLDAARYADSYGYQSDQLCNTWPYRDWVIAAFNNNLSYDKFLTEQLAGDLIPHPSRKQRLATAFNRLHRQTNEGGSIEDEWRNEYVSDRVHTFGTTFLALTFECARCHDHKFDPILQRDYYSLGAFFNSIDEYGLYNDSAHVPTPSLLLPTPEQEKAMLSTAQTLQAKANALTEAGQGSEPAFQDWLKRSDLSTNIPGLLAHFTFDALTGDHQIANELKPGELSSPIHGNTLVAGKTGQALQFTGDDEFTLPANLGSLQPWDQYSVVFWLQIPKTITNGIIFHASRGTDSGFFGTELSLDQGRLFFAVKRFWPGNALAVRSLQTLPPGEWVQVGVSADGSGKAEGVTLFVNGELIKTEIVRNHLEKSPQNDGASLSFGARFRSAGLKGGLLDELRVYNRPLAPVEMRQLFDGHALHHALAQKNQGSLREYYYAAIVETIAQARADRAQALKTWLAARDPVQETSVMEELPAPRPAYLLARGRYDAPKDETTFVARATPAALPPFPTNAPRNRLGLAQWLTEPHHPLTARVAVNRYWQMFFGRGIVATTENFGVQGAPPSHPELLDWLARDFVNSGWDTKALLKKIVLSATYRQDSKLRPDLREKDPENLLLARGPSQRLPAEMIRDTALAASGLLQEDLGGPPVSPYSPGDLWRESNAMSPAYHQSVGESLYRRSLYTVWKRTAPMPDMMAFDAPSREVCVVKRNNTSSPQQAFVLLNDTQFVEAARVLAEKAIKEAGADSEARIRFVFQRLTARDPDAQELKLLMELLHEQSSIFEAEPARAERLVSVGDRKRDPALNLVELAATTTLAQAILNLDATIWKR